MLLTVATDVEDRRKGGDLLMDALQSVSYRPLKLVTLGRGNLQTQAAGICVSSLGFVDHERTKALAYSAADMLVHPAPVDNLPNVVMEAIACGTPVVCFPVGGVPEMVRPGSTGWVAEGVTADSLARVIDKALTEISTRDWRSSCRAVAEADYGIELQTDRYVELFHSLRTSKNSGITVH
jgi:glycosyltransferase involved in cell wall biosynthesis